MGMHTDRNFTLAQAAMLTGFSKGKFRYNKAKLLEHGVVITTSGWTIPSSALIAIGWDGNSREAEIPFTQMQQASLKIAELENEVEQLREELSRRAKKRGFFTR